MTTFAAPRVRARKRLLTVGHSYVRRTCRRLAEAIQIASDGDWEVTVAAPEHYQGNPRFGDLRPESLVIGDDERVKVVGIPVAFTNRVHFALYGRQLQQLMASGFDAIHCWEEPFILSGAQMAQWTPPGAILTFFSWQNIDKSYPPPFNWLERRTMTRADGWVAGGTLSERVLKNRQIYRDRPFRVIGSGIEPKIFRPDSEMRRQMRASLGWGDADNDVPVVGYLGRLAEEKGLSLLLRVLDAIKTPWRALFVGSGLLEAELRRWSERYGSRVRFVPTIANEEVPKYLNAMDMICVPSQTTPTWHEQFGRVLIEAFACGVCVVASDSGEIPHVVADAGRIIGERDEKGWQREIEALLVDHALRRELTGRGLVRVQENYTWSAIGAKYVEFFDSLYASRHSLASAR